MKKYCGKYNVEINQYSFSKFDINCCLPILNENSSIGGAAFRFLKDFWVKKISASTAYNYTMYTVYNHTKYYALNAYNERSH